MRKAAEKREIKQERAARTRVEILEAAITLFARRGILATTMAQLAKAIRMTPGALYWHFPTKEDLLLAAIDELHGRYYAEFDPVLTEQQTFPASVRLKTFMERTHQFLRSHREYGIFFGMVAAESAENNDRVAEALREKLGIYVTAVENIILHGQQQTKEFRQDVDAKHAAHGIIGAFIGAMLHQNLFRESVPYDGMHTALAQLLVEGTVTR
ncbi:MAG TPA: TetR family transcriptional regulator [Archangium sp.]|uniref:TetR/AcrR family transcriptional regulator n=1 Tax=Archangium sp. TaxID=1872627 RepID=UPI002E36220B|nr:TetR family transcriptional regulator [Archangium sp.]HEX5754402.1 TetR family transcriptional regulator [Archangium sp.]